VVSGCERAIDRAQTEGRVEREGENQASVAMVMVSFTKVALPSVLASFVVSYAFWDLSRNRKIFGGQFFCFFLPLSLSLSLCLSLSLFDSFSVTSFCRFLDLNMIGSCAAAVDSFFNLIFGLLMLS